MEDLGKSSELLTLKHAHAI